MGWIQDLVKPQQRVWEEFYRNRWVHDRVVRSTHGVNCTGGCSWAVYVKDGIITREMQQTDYPLLESKLPLTGLGKGRHHFVRGQGVAGRGLCPLRLYQIRACHVAPPETAALSLIILTCRWPEAPTPAREPHPPIPCSQKSPTVHATVTALGASLTLFKTVPQNVGGIRCGAFIPTESWKAGDTGMRKETTFKLLACLIALSVLSCGGGNTGGPAGAPPLGGPTSTWLPVLRAGAVGPVEPNLTWLGTLGGTGSGAYGVSADGRVVVGWARNADGHWRAFRWENGVMQDLGTLPGSILIIAYAVSADGRVVVGWADNDRGQRRAFRWTESERMQDLGTLDGGRESAAYGVSADGNVVVGWSRNAAGQSRAFRWKPGEGMRDLNEIYASLLRSGSYLGTAHAISRDGRFIVGWGHNAATGRGEAFLLDTGGQ